MAQGTLFDTGDPVKLCRKCKKLKIYTDFPIYCSKFGKIKRTSPCKQCSKERPQSPEAIEATKKLRQKYRDSPKGKRSIKNINVKRFGLTVEEFEAMQLNQNNLCAICNLPETKLSRNHDRARSLAVDHNHTTGAVRQLLCSDCNTILGLAKENPFVLREAAKYLEKHENK